MMKIVRGMMRRWVGVMTACVCLLAVSLLGCGRSERDARLERISTFLSTNPYAALDSLNSIDKSLLSENNFYYHEFLTLKANDKAYVLHTSDSLYKCIRNYYSNHKSEYPYFEILYYGGRVYSDIGDYPTALRYFQEALEEIPNEAIYDDIRGNILSQTGRLLSHLRLYKQAVPYLEQSLNLTIAQNDTINLPYEYQQLGTLYMHTEDYDTAMSYLKDSYKHARKLKEEDISYIRGNIAALYYKMGNIDSALYYIRNTPERVFEHDKDFFRAYAAKIYYDAGKYDTAFFYAKLISESPIANYRMIGYRKLLSNELKHYSHPDSVNKYIEKYFTAAELNYNQNDSEAAIIQNSMYNYSIHEQKNKTLTESRNRVIIGLLAALCVIMSLILILIYFRYRYLKTLSGYNKALSVIHDLNIQLGVSSAEKIIENRITGQNQLRNRIESELCILKKAASKYDYTLNPYLKSDGYIIITEALKNNKILSMYDPLWKKLESTIEEYSPDFVSNINRLCFEKLSIEDYNLIILIKYRIPLTQISQLFGIVKSTISHRRSKICRKNFSGLITPEEMDTLIYLL